MPKVLIADDSFALANLLEFILKRNGFDVTVARRGDKAAEECSRERYDVIVLDQSLPGMAGLDVVRHMRSGGPNFETPVYMCTAKTYELDLSGLQSELQIEGVFHKPFSPREFVDALLGSVVSPAIQ